MFKKTSAFLSYFEKDNRKKMVVRISKEDLEEGATIYELKQFFMNAEIVKTDYDIDANEFRIIMEEENND